MRDLPFRLLPGLTHSGFSIRSSDGAVACLRDDAGERCLTISAEGQAAPMSRLINDAQMNAITASLGSSSRAPDTKSGLQSPVWSPDGNSLAFGYRGVWTIKPDGSDLRRVSDRPVEAPGAGRGAAGATNLNAERNAYVTWRPDGRSLFFLSCERGAAVALFEVSADGTWERKIGRDVMAIPSFALSPSGNRLAVVATDGRETELWIVLLADAGLDLRTSALDIGAYAGRPLYRHSKILWLTETELVLRGSGRTGWSKHELFTLESDQVVHQRSISVGDWEDGELVVSSDGRRGVLSSREGTVFEENLWLIDFESGDRRRIPLNLPTGFQMPIAWREDKIFFTYSSPFARGDLYVVDLAASSSGQRLTFSDDLLIARQDFDIEVVMAETEPGGPSVRTILFLPVNAKGPLPAVVWCHGGPALAVDLGWQRHPAWLASAGFAVAVPAFRGSTALGVPFMEAGYEENLGVADVEDVLAAGRYLASRAEVDSSRIGVAGRSWGGYLTLRALTNPKSDGLFRCGWAAAAIADWEVQQAETEVRCYDFQLLGGFLPEETIRERARDRSPIHDLKRLTGPVLVTHGRDDKDVPFKQIDRFVEHARRNGLENVLHEFYEGEGHANRKPENILAESSRALQFLRAHLCSWDFESNPCGRQVAY